MTLNRVILSATFLLSATFAFANESQSTDADVMPLHDRYWECSAHNSHNEYNIYYGELFRSRQQAMRSAIHECEHHENHSCVSHECYMVDESQTQ